MFKKLPFLLFVMVGSMVFSQKKSELFAQIDELKSEKSAVEQQLAEAKREISSSNAKAETLEVENEGLRDANATLLKNLSSFSQLSKQNSENVNKAMAALERKEKQLSGINDMISSNDSVAVVSLARIQQMLGENGKVNVTEGIVILSNSLNILFGSDTGLELTEPGKLWLSNVAKIITANPSFMVEIEGLNITGEFGSTFDQASAIAKELVGAHGIPSDKLNIVAKDGNFREGINIKLHPDYKGFYGKAKESIKGSQ